MLGDGAYDHTEVYEDLEARGIGAAIKPRRNSRIDTHSEARRMEVKVYKHLGHRRWTMLKGYHRRWSVETAYSTLKRTFGSFCRAKTMKKITRDLITKAAICNMLIDR